MNLCQWAYNAFNIRVNEFKKKKKIEAGESVKRATRESWGREKISKSLSKFNGYYIKLLKNITNNIFLKHNILRLKRI